jgi:DNA adenine methylase
VPTLPGCDPPYWGVEGYGVDFGIEEYGRLAEAAKLIKGKMIITVNKVPEMRKAFKGLRAKAVSIGYTLGSKAGGAASRQELIIKNW